MVHWYLYVFIDTDRSPDRQWNHLPAGPWRMAISWLLDVEDLLDNTLMFRIDLFL